MPISDSNHDGEYPLDDSINKLETYINETEEQPPGEPAPVLSAGNERDYTVQDVPILDELVSNDAPAGQPVTVAADTAATEHQLLDLVDNLEHRLTSVLETLVNSMKNEMIDTISEEVKTQLDSYQQKLDLDHHADRTSVDEPDYRHLDGYRPYGE